jgi:hypothetical protein
VLQEPPPSIPTLAPPAAAGAPDPRLAPEVPTPDVAGPPAPETEAGDLPDDLRPLARRARRDTAATAFVADEVVARAHSRSVPAPRVS